LRVYMHVCIAHSLFPSVRPTACVCVCVLQFACQEHEPLPPSPHMGINTFHALVRSLLQGGDIDIDVLLMLKDEVSQPASQSVSQSVTQSVSQCQSVS
jgi:hypothetical protein